MFLKTQTRISDEEKRDDKMRRNEEKLLHSMNDFQAVDSDPIDEFKNSFVYLYIYNPLYILYIYNKIGIYMYICTYMEK